MKGPNGENPLRWNCESRGCYRKHCCPHIEDFASAFPRQVGMTDVDYWTMAEIGNHFLWFDWKSFQDIDPNSGQVRAMRRFSELSPRIHVILVHHAPNNPDEILSVCSIHRGRVGKWEPCTKAELKDRIWRWAKAADERRSMRIAS